VTLGQFETISTIGEALATNMVEFIDQCGSKKKIVAYVKNERSNLKIAFKLIVKCEVLSLDESFQGTCFGHAFFKAC
jgi:ABC-type multidrug transport system ATPase subunit